MCKKWSQRLTVVEFSNGVKCVFEGKNLMTSNLYISMEILSGFYFTQRKEFVFLCFSMNVNMMSEEKKLGKFHQIPTQINLCVVNNNVDKFVR
jgi:hypothetical protein